MVDPILASEEDWRKAAQQWANKTWKDGSETFSLQKSLKK